jgi:hypothetical protein
MGRVIEDLNERGAVGGEDGRLTGFAAPDGVAVRGRSIASGRRTVCVATCTSCVEDRRDAVPVRRSIRERASIGLAAERDRRRERTRCKRSREEGDRSHRDDCDACHRAWRLVC